MHQQIQREQLLDTMTYYSKRKELGQTKDNISYKNGKQCSNEKNVSSDGGRGKSSVYILQT
jgi:hypothetical protein